MKTFRQAIIGAVALSFAAAIHTFAITNTAIAVSGTNIVLSWPSSGYEIYLVRSRQTLDPSDSWSCVTNAYPANSASNTTFTIYGVVPPPATGTGGSHTSGLPPSPNLATSFMMAGNMGPLAVPADGSRAAVPVALYPPGFDLSGFTIFDPLTGESVSGSDYMASPRSWSNPQPLDGDGIGSGDPPAVDMKFFEVFHIPNFAAGITNYTFDGPTFIPVDFASPDADPNYVDSTTVLINGQPTDYAQFMPYVISGVTNWGVGIYFDRFPNGTSTIQLLTTLRQSDTLNDQTPYIVFSNAPANITIGNLITFTNWADLILSNSYTFKAQSVPNVDWEIDISDVNGQFVNYQTGHTDDGNISWTWNLMDYWGNSRLGDSDPFFYPYITITGNLGNSAQNGGSESDSGNNSSASEWTPSLAEQFPGSGSWLFAYLDKDYDDGTSNYIGADYYYTNGIHTMEGYPWQWQIAAYDYPIKFGRTYSQAERDASWQGTTNSSGLIDWLQYYPIRNFYYYGHGWATGIGGDISILDASNNIIGSKTLPGSHAYLTSEWVAHHITSNPYSGAIPFRFVFLDGCNTAVGDWPTAWRVPKQTVGPDWYRNSANNPTGARPNVFLGWDVEIGGRKDWGTVDKFWAFREDWMGEWANTIGRELNFAIEDAFNASQWVNPDHYNHLKEYGYTSMGFFEFNHAGDWP